MILQHKQILNNNGLHSIRLVDGSGIYQTLISSLSGMEILGALSLSHNLTPHLNRQYLLERAKELTKQQNMPTLLLRYFDSITQLNDSYQLSAKQYISIYATVMNVKVKEYFINQKQQLFSNVYIPNKSVNTICIYQCHNNNYLSLIKTSQMNVLILMEDMISIITQQVCGQSQSNKFEFDIYPEENTLGYNTPERDIPKFQRRHKKSFSDHQIIDWHRFHGLQESPTEQPEFNLFFSLNKQPEEWQPQQQQQQQQQQIPQYSFPPPTNQIRQMLEDQVTKDVPHVDDRYQYYNNNEYDDDLERIKATEDSSSQSYHDIPKLNHQMSAPQQDTRDSCDEFKLQYSGKLKFFDEQKNYGFIVMDGDKSDIFVHLDDLLKAGVNKEYLKVGKQGQTIRFMFNCMVYVGKYKKSRKAVDLKLLPNNTQYNYKGII